MFHNNKCQLKNTMISTYYYTRFKINYSGVNNSFCSVANTGQ